MKKLIFGFSSLLLAAFVFASFGIYIRILNQDLNTYQQIFFRGFIGFVIASLLALSMKKKISFAGVPKKILIAYSVFFPIVVMLFTFSILSTKLATTLFGFYVGTLTTSLIIGIKFFNEPINIIKKISLSLSFLGLLIYTFPLSLSSFNTGLILALVAGSLDAIANALRKYLSNKIDRLLLIVLQMFGMALISIPFVLFTLGNGLPTISMATWIVGVWFGLMLIVVNYLLLYGFSNFDLNLGSIVLSSELFFAGAIGILLYNEMAKPQEFVGSLIIILAMAVTSIDFNKLTNSLKRKKDLH